MPKNRLTMYAPFLLVVLVQALFVGLYPSTGEDRSVTTGGFDSQFSTPSGFDQAAPGAATPAAGGAGTSGGFTATTLATVAGGGANPSSPTPAAPSGGSGGAATPAPGGAAAPATTAPSGGGGQAATPAAGDTSHCVGERQMDVFAVEGENPLCKPKWPEGADNGGATWNGVSGDTIKVIIMEPSSSEAVDAVLKSQGLASTAEDREAVNEVANVFFNQFYETYGREIVFERYPANCPTSPFDVPACLADTRKVIEMNPFAVFFNQPSYPELFEELTRAGIISIGGWHFTGELFNNRRPFRWDVFVDGSQSAQYIIEYYCKKLAGKNASHSGATIHPLVGTRDAVPRKVGILVPESPAYRPDATVVQQGIQGCGSEANVYTFTQNIDQAQSEANTISQAMINDGITTALCMCDPITPAFMTSAFSSNSYFPEHLMAGTGLLDADQVGRLYTREQWIHAFGLSHINETRPFEDEQVSRAFAAVGRTDTPCSSCNLPWVYYSVLGAMVHYAGPDLNPGTVEAGLFGAPKFRGAGTTVGIGYGPNDYSAIDDVREAYWVPTARSDVDGQAGSYRSMNDGRRYQLGEFDSSFEVPVEPTNG